MRQPAKARHGEHGAAEGILSHSQGVTALLHVVGDLFDLL